MSLFAKGNPGRPRGAANRGNRGRNERIIEMRKRCLTFGQIAMMMRISRGVVSGVVWRCA